MGTLGRGPFVAVLPGVKRHTPAAVPRGEVRPERACLWALALLRRVVCPERACIFGAVDGRIL